MFIIIIIIIIKKVLYMLGGLLGLYVIIGFFYPIIPLTGDWKELISQKMYVATWIQVYSNNNTFSNKGKDITIRQKIPGATPWNSRQVEYFTLVTPESVYYRMKKIEGADPQSLKVVSFNTFSLLGPGYRSKTSLYLYDDNNVYIGTNLTLPRGGTSADVVYAKYLLEKSTKDIIK